VEIERFDLARKNILSRVRARRSFAKDAQLFQGHSSLDGRSARFTFRPSRVTTTKRRPDSGSSQTPSIRCRGKRGTAVISCKSRITSRVSTGSIDGCWSSTGNRACVIVVVTAKVRNVIAQIVRPGVGVPEIVCFGERSISPSPERESFFRASRSVRFQLARFQSHFCTESVDCRV